LKRRQQVLKPRGSLDINITLKPLLSVQQGQHGWDRHWRGTISSAGVADRGKGTGRTAWEPGRSCSEASCRSSGCESHQRRGPATAVVISSGGEGDQTVESLDVKVPDGWESGRIRTEGRANWQAVANVRTVEAPKWFPRVKRICGTVGSAEPLTSRRRLRQRRCSGTYRRLNSPGSVGDGMSGRNGQRKPGTARGWPRRSRTAEAPRISRSAAKSRCAREWGAWGRISDDGSGQHNLNRSEDPWGQWSIPPHGGAVIASTDPTLGGSTLKHEGRRQTER